MQDNTNADTEVRARWIQLARAHDVPIRCFHFTAPSLLCQHNNVVRALNGTLVGDGSRGIAQTIESGVVSEIVG